MVAFDVVQVAYTVLQVLAPLAMTQLMGERVRVPVAAFASVHDRMPLAPVLVPPYKPPQFQLYELAVSPMVPLLVPVVQL